jgi:subtilisin family serine protease
VIAVVDSGVEASHPDLLGAVDPGPADVHGHGTAVAGLAAARANNGLGAAGACWSCRILMLGVIDEGGFLEEESLLGIAVRPRIPR